VTTPTCGNLPVLRNWLEWIGDHSLRWFFQSRRDTPRPPNTAYAWWRNPILVAMEDTLAILEAAQPDGLGAKRREFRAFKTMGSGYMDQFMTHRVELVIASLLAEASISFRFNTKAGPDLLINEDRNNVRIDPVDTPTTQQNAPPDRCRPHLRAPECKIDCRAGPGP
jgi:hypothetical protein